MIKIKNITLKNFMSIGNCAQAVSFESDYLTLIVGENLDQGGPGEGRKNAVGKSSLISAVCYALYGYPISNIKKDNLINIVNGKHMLVTLSLEKDNIQYRIERGRKPNILKLFVNDKEVSSQESDESLSDSRDTQKDIDEIIGMSYDMFKHIVALNTYTEPFLSMKANDQRVIIEQLLGITILSEKADKLRELIKQTKDQIFQETANIEAIKKSNETIQKSIQNLKIKQQNWASQKDKDLEKLAKAIISLENVNIDIEIELHNKHKEFKEKSNILKSLTKEKNNIEKSLSQIVKSIESISLNIDSISNNQCHTCGQKIHDSKQKELLNEHATQLEDLINNQSNLEEELKKVNKKLNDLGEITEPEEPYYDTIDQAYQHQSNLKRLEEQLSAKSDEVDPYQDQIEDLKNTAIQEINWDNINKLTTEKDHQEFLLNLLTNKGSFIRKKIIDQNLSFLNNRLTYYLSSMGLPHNVIFQNDLSVEITYLGKDLDFHNLSRGEMNRLILSLSFTFRDVWENLYHHMNIMFIDELIDNGLDSSGTDNVLSILKQMSRDRKKNVFLISHKDELMSRVSTILKVIKENGFSSFEEYTEK